MVTFQRRSSSSSVAALGVAIGFGMENEDAVRCLPSTFAHSNNVSVPLTCRGGKRRISNSSWSGSAEPISPIKILCCITFLSWTAALYLSSQSHSILVDLEYRHRRQRQTLEESQQFLVQLKDDIEGQKIYVKNLEHTLEALDHELRVVSELEDAEIDLTPISENGELIQAWLDHRVEGLDRRVGQLTTYLQDFSRLEVTKRFGPGPHYVRFTVQIESGSTRSFVVELAPLDVLPHSVHFFLETVALELWDNTIFIRQEKAPHILAAAPVDYHNHEPKHHRLSFLGWTKLGFPEYSSEWGQHDAYTLGFTHSGPTFYVNVAHNGDVHGPGKQGHHVLKDDADPCFGRVIQGKDVIDDILQLELHHNPASRDNIEVDQDDIASARKQSWTQLVSIRLLDDYRRP